MKNVFLPLLAAAAFIIAVGLLTQNAGTLKQENTQGKLKQIKIGKVELSAEVVSSATQRSTGLSGRESLEEGSGMLFDFTDRDDALPVFWMKDMLFDLDIIWIDDGEIVQIDKNVPAEAETPESQLTRYAVDNPIDYVLEVNAGFSEKNKVKIGDEVDLTNLN